MAISRIITGDIFSKDMQAGEDQIKIACGTNTAGGNDPRSNSVASQIGRLYIPAFQNLGKGDFGQVHTHTFDFHGKLVKALAIVCNEQNPKKWNGDKDADWTKSVESIRRGFETIADIFQPTNMEDMLKELQSQAIILSESGGINLPLSLQQALDTYRSKLIPIVRTVLIGTGQSGRNGNADIAGILDAMHQSSANLHLYINDQKQAAQVAQVIPLFPSVSQLAAVPGYNNIRQGA